MLKQERKIASIWNCFQDADLLKTYTNADLRAYLIMIAIQVLHNAVESGVGQLSQKKHYEGVRFNVISITRGCQMSR